MAKSKKAKKSVWKKIKAGLLKRHPFATAAVIIGLCAVLLAGFAPDSPLAINKPNYRVAVSISGPTSVTAGTNVKYTLKVKNTGKKTLKSAVGQFIPSNLVVSKPSGCAANARNITCDIKNLGAGSTKSFSITLNYPNGSGSRKLTATAMAFGTPTSSNPTDTKYLFVNVKSIPNYALSVSISGVTNPTVPGRPYTYVAMVKNTGKKKMARVNAGFDPWQNTYCKAKIITSATPKQNSVTKGPGWATTGRWIFKNIPAGGSKKIVLTAVWPTCYHVGDVAGLHFWANTPSRSNYQAMKPLVVKF